MLKIARVLLLLLPLALVVASCDKGPAEKAGEKVDKAMGN